jgi:transcriptional regulator with XRE-family HTH domain
MNENWPAQETFCQRVKAYCEKNGLVTPRGAIKLPEAAALFQVSEITMKQLLQHKLRKRPHYDTLAKIAGIVGCPVSLFMDDPGGPLPGMAHAEWGGLTETERAYATAMYSDISSKDLTPAEKELLFGAYRDLKARLLSFRK